VKALSRVIFHVQPRDADTFSLSAGLNFKSSLNRQRQFVHGNLVALRQIGVKVILAGEARPVLYLAADRERGPQREFQSSFVQYRQRAR
jgi:hypothetical protein